MDKKIYKFKRGRGFMKELKNSDLILMYLRGFEEFKEEDEVLYGLTTRGITKTIGITEKEFVSNKEHLIENDLIIEKVQPIISLERKRNVYFLSEKGKKREREIWEEIKESKVILRTEDKEKELQLKDLKNHISGRNPVIKGLRFMEEENIIDLTSLDKHTEVFVGRENEQNKLKESLKEVKKDGSKILFIEGEAGIGKTSLVSKLKPYVQELGFEFLTGTCQSESSDPYLPFKEAFDRYVKGQDEDMVQEKGTGIAFMGVKDKDSIEEKKLFDAKKRETFFETTRYIEKIAKETPLVIFLDDLQWVDRATIDILAYMDEKIEDVPVFFIGAYRPEDVTEDHHLVEIMHRLKREGRYDKIKLKPLTVENTEETIKGVLGTKDIKKSFVKIIHDKTGGNPLFIKESVRQMVDENILDLDSGTYPEQSDEVLVSEMVHNVIERRVNRLDKKSVKIIEIGSVIGSSIPFELLSSITKLDDIDLLDTIDILIGNQLWDEKLDEETFCFTHPLLRETVYKKIKSLKKKLLHKKTAKNIEELYQDDLNKWYSNLARHYEGAENFSKAFKYYLKAAEKAEEVYANEDALEMYERALNLSDKIEEMEREITNFELLEKIAKAYYLLGRYEGAKEYLEKALGYAENDKEKQRMYRKIARIYREKGEFQECLEYSNDGLKITDEENVERCRLLNTKGWAQMRLGRYDDAVEVFKEEKTVAEKLDEKRDIGQGLHDLGTVHALKGDYDTSEDYLKRAVDVRKEIDDKSGMSESLNNLGEVNRFKGNLDEALDYYKQSYNIDDEMGHRWSLAITISNMGMIYKNKGDLDKALDQYNRSLEINKEIGSKHGQSFTLNNIGEVYLEKGDLDEALKYYKKQFTITDDVGEKKGKIEALCGIAETKLRKGDQEEAEENAMKALDIAQDIGAKVEEGLAHRVLAMVYREDEKWEDSQDEFEEAIGVLEERGEKNELPRVHYEYGLMWDERGAVEKAKTHLQKALSIFDEIGKELWIKKVEDKIEEVISDAK